MSEQSRVEDLLLTGVEEPVEPMSEVESILRGAPVTPHSRVADALLRYNPSDILIEKTVTENGTYVARNDSADGYSKVVVNTPVAPSPVYDQLDETITENGEYSYTPEHDGFDSVDISVNVESHAEPILNTKTITENGTYDASDDTTTRSGTLTIPTIATNSFGHIDITNMAELTKFTIYCRFEASAGAAEKCEAVISNIPTYTPSVYDDWRNMYRIYSWNSSNEIYISKDSTGIWIGRYGGIELSNASYEYEKPLDGYSQVVVNVQSSSEEVKPLTSNNFDTFVVNAQYATGSWTDGVLSFDLNDYANNWTTFVSLRSIAIDFTGYSKFMFDVDITDQQDYSELSVIISPELYSWGSSDWPGVFNATTKLETYITESGSYEIDTSTVTGNQYIYIIANTSTHNRRGNDSNGLLVGTVSNFAVAVDSNIYMQEGVAPGSTGTSWLEFDKPPVAGYYIISLYSNSETFVKAIWFEPGLNSESFTFKPDTSTTYSCYILWDNNEATLRISCSVGQWYVVKARVTKVDAAYIINS